MLRNVFGLRHTVTAMTPLPQCYILQTSLWEAHYVVKPSSKYLKAGCAKGKLEFQENEYL